MASHILFFHLMWCFQGSAVVAACVSTSFLARPSDAPLYGCTTFWPIHLLMDLCVVATLWPIGVEPPWTLVCRCLLGRLFSVLTGIYLGVEWLGHLLILFNVSRNHFIIFDVRYLKIIQNEAYSLDRIFFFFLKMGVLTLLRTSE